MSGVSTVMREDEIIMMLPQARGCQQPLGAGSDREQVLAWSLQKEAAILVLACGTHFGFLLLWATTFVVIHPSSSRKRNRAHFLPLRQNTFGKVKILVCHTDYKSKRKLEMLFNS